MKFHYGSGASPSFRGSRDDFTAVERFPFSFLIWTFGSICVINYMRSKKKKNPSQPHITPPVTRSRFLAAPHRATASLARSPRLEPVPACLNFPCPEIPIFSSFAPKAGCPQLGTSQAGSGRAARSPSAPGMATSCREAAVPVMLTAPRAPRVFIYYFNLFAIKNASSGGSGRAIHQAGAGPPPGAHGEVISRVLPLAGCSH